MTLFLSKPFNMIKKVLIKIFNFALLIFHSRGMYIVEGHEKPAVLPDITPYVSQMAIRNDSME